MAAAGASAGPWRHPRRCAWPLWAGCGGVSRAVGRLWASRGASRRGARAGRVRAPAGRRLCVLLQIGDQLVAGVVQFLLVDDVITVEDGAALVAGQQHGDPLGDAGADQGAGGGAAAIVEEAGRHPGRLTGGAPRRAPAPDGDAVAVELRSYLGAFLNERGPSLGAEDERGFPMRLLHFRRTFVEKLFAIHSKVELLKRDRRPIGSYARHYYDLFQLAAQPEVATMLRSDEYAAIKADYDAISRAYFPQSYFCPSEMSFAGSDGLFPQGELARTIAGEYEVQCRQLCFGPYPPWEDVQARFEDLRESL